MTTEYVTVETSGAEGYSNLRVWLRDCAPYVPGIQRSVLKRQLLLAFREFCAESFAWRGSFGPVAVVAGQNQYAMSPFNSYTDVIGVMAVEANGVGLQPLYRRPNPPTVIGQTSPPTSDFPSGFYMLRPDIFCIYPTPVTPLPNAVNLTGYVALQPKMSTEQVPAIAQTHFYDAILNGLLYRLLSQPAKPYSNALLAVTFEQKFRSLVAEYAGKAKTGFNGGASWKFPRFGK